jgi:hypothetical protein
LQYFADFDHFFDAFFDAGGGQKPPPLIIKLNLENKLFQSLKIRKL